jgi:hypothetical protein
MHSACVRCRLYAAMCAAPDVATASKRLYLRVHVFNKVLVQLTGRMLCLNVMVAFGARALCHCCLHARPPPLELATRYKERVP